MEKNQFDYEKRMVQPPLSPPNPSSSPSPNPTTVDAVKMTTVAAPTAAVSVPASGADTLAPQTISPTEPTSNTASDGVPTGNIPTAASPAPTSVYTSGPAVVPVNMVPAPTPQPEPDMNDLPDNPMPKHQAKFALNTIKNVKRLKDAGPFLKPVDIIKLNIPFYYNFVPKPMDLSTIEKKLTVSAYEVPEQFIDDFNLMVSNCIKFNGENSPIAKMGKNIQAYFEKHMLNFPPKEANESELSTASKRRIESQSSVPSIASNRPKRNIHPPKPKELPYDNRPRKKKFAADLRFCNQILKDLISKKHFSYNFPFLQPVDAVALNIPNYSDIIKQPMDLSTIQSKLANNQYENGDEFESDVTLMFENCYKFNPEGTDVSMMGHKLQDIFQKKWINRPIPKDTPQNSDNEDYSDDEFSDDNSDVDESVLSNIPAIKFLEDQLIRMTQELDKLKKDHLLKIKQQREQRRKSRASGKNRKRSGSMAHSTGGKSKKIKLIPQIQVTYEMKKQVSEQVPNLPDKKLQEFIKIIKDDVDLNDEEEVELDMDQLEDKTILKLYNFLFDKKPAKAKKMELTTNYDKLTKLKNQLSLFDEGMRAESSDDDDMSSESSEEE